MAGRRDGNGSVNLPHWIIGALFTIAFGAFVTWAIADRQRIGQMIQSMGDRITRLETVHQLEDTRP